jgi:hypothetical protein
VSSRYVVRCPRGTNCGGSDPPQPCQPAGGVLSVSADSAWIACNALDESESAFEYSVSMSPVRIAQPGLGNKSAVVVIAAQDRLSSVRAVCRDASRLSRRGKIWRDGGRKRKVLSGINVLEQ